MPSEWDRPHMRWTLRLEYVLSDRTALDAFRDWLVANSSPQPLELHFALLAYDRMSAQRNVQTADLARSIYQKYISLRTSSCCFNFIPHKLRQEVGASLKASGSGFPDPRLFANILPYVDSFLRQQHEQFVCSEEFLEAFNRMNMSCEDPSDFSAERRRSGSSSKKPQLTAETLMKTRFDREYVLGESSLEKMYATTSMPRPYVCHATTSQNDSAVSSSFSSDANGHRPTRLRSIREEHLRGNPTTFAIPRVEHHHSKADMKFDHNTEDGRKVFAGVLCKKLNRLQVRRERNDETERQLRDIENRKCTTRELVSTSEAAHVATCDDDDDVECYLERMREDSLKTSANRSPCHNAVSPRPFSPEHDRRKLDCGDGDVSIAMRSTLNYPRSTNQFAPPPLPNTFNTSGVYYKEIRSANQTAPIYDSSGVESMAPSAFSDTSGGTRKTPLIAPMMATPRRTRRSLPSGQLMTISYKGIDGVPVVAHVPVSVRGITLKEFRRHFSISSHANVQFFFKSTCEDGSAPYQLLLVNEDSAYLPVFEGKNYSRVEANIARMIARF
ncbi:Pry-1p [Parelaphostrongylus tenuis]|uniref:Pry-1p n=1 Tax=Parelaphostrongylus tenuis TaxID=148309 RepID=A0AAD5RBX0_PARTN|nr:Pry-1p [Parelaphostrongylus tenuis]